MNEYGALVEWYWQGILKCWEKTLYSVGRKWMFIEHWWNDTDRGKWNAGRKHYIAWVVAEWMLTEHCWNNPDRANWIAGKKHYTAWVVNEWLWSICAMTLTVETEMLGQEYYRTSVVDEWMSMEHWWNDTDRWNCCPGVNHFKAWIVDEWMSLKHWWNDTDREKCSAGSKKF